jgi:hypothetical protein
MWNHISQHRISCYMSTLWPLVSTQHLWGQAVGQRLLRLLQKVPRLRKESLRYLARLFTYVTCLFSLKSQNYIDRLFSRSGVFLRAKSLRISLNIHGKKVLRELSNELTFDIRTYHKVILCEKNMLLSLCCLLKARSLWVANRRSLASTVAHLVAAWTINLG